MIVTGWEAAVAAVRTSGGTRVMSLDDAADLITGARDGDGTASTEYALQSATQRVTVEYLDGDRYEITEEIL